MTDQSKATNLPNNRNHISNYSSPTPEAQNPAYLSKKTNIPLKTNSKVNKHMSMNIKMINLSNVRNAIGSFARTSSSNMRKIVRKCSVRRGSHLRQKGLINKLNSSKISQWCRLRMKSSSPKRTNGKSRVTS
jgi:hypothetical protein